MTTTVEERDRPILFTGWSIRRIFEDAKTETRRRTGLDEINEDPDRYTHDCGHAFWSEGEYYRVLSGRDGVSATSVKCPYGGAYDPLWVREAFRLPVGFGDDSPTEAICTNDCGSEEECNGGCHAWKFEADGGVYGPESELARTIARWGRLRPSIYMPKKLCRLRLSLKSVRLQRLQEIRAEAAIREGIEQAPGPDGETTVYGREDAGWTTSPVKAFRNLFSEIHSREVWDRNEWVWVLHFSKTTSN